ncbi:hypothetical protein ACRE9J_19015, partial [Klebsiella pneumoniae]
IQPATGSFARNLIYSTKPFFGHITPYMNVMRRLLLNCQPPALIMSLTPEIRQNILQLTESEDERTK